VASIAGLSWAADLQAKETSASVGRAWQMMQEGADRREVVAMVEPLALAGGELAQLMLGAIFFDGKDVPRDPVQGYAWLQVAATAADAAIAKRAQDMMRTNAQGLSGGELIRADQRAAAIRSTVAERLYARYSAGLQRFTAERPVSFTPWITFGTEMVQLSEPDLAKGARDFQLGCAAADNRLCAPQSRSAEGPRCTGKIVQADAGPTTMGKGSYVVRPEYPVRLRNSGVGGTVIFIAHVDRSGWICGAAIAESSGEAALDKEALEALIQWRLIPAMREGEAVEALHRLALDFRVRET
jgi:TonB family protein